MIAKHAKITYIEIMILGVLGILSLVSGYLFKDIFLGLGSSYFNNGVTILPRTWVIVEAELLAPEVKMLPLIFTALAMEVESRFFECKWFYNEIVNGYLALPTLILSRHFFEQYEKRTLEFNGPLMFSYGLAQAQYQIDVVNLEDENDEG